MLCLRRQDLQVCGTIIGAITVEMVDDLAWKQEPTEVVLGKSAIPIDALAVTRYEERATVAGCTQSDH